jgi:glycosyltransferase involved in cell wall biosynthesis
MRVIGIDASNLLEGGGVTHLQELLQHSNPISHNFDKIIIWGASKTLSKISDQDWIEKKSNKFLNGNLFSRLFWRIFLSKFEYKKYNCSILFSPGGSDSSGFKPMVTMCRNMLPFESNQALKFGFGFMYVKFLLLKYFQSKSFLKANGLIFLTNYASRIVEELIPTLGNKSVIIPHGISRRFFIEPRKHINAFDSTNKCKVIYVSKTDPYKHHLNVINAVYKLNLNKYHVELNLIGPSGSSAKKVDALINKLDPNNQYLKNLGKVDYESLSSFYKSSDISVFASSCENMPNILLESMASGLPIACSNLGPMPEILGNNAVYFSPYNVDEIYSSISKLINSEKLRSQLASSSYLLANSYSWEKCALDTFNYLNKVYLTYNNQTNDKK